MAQIICSFDLGPPCDSQPLFDCLLYNIYLYIHRGSMAGDEDGTELMWCAYMRSLKPIRCLAQGPLLCFKRSPRKLWPEEHATEHGDATDPVQSKVC